MSQPMRTPNDADLEMTVIGTVMAYPTAMKQLDGYLSADLFSDDAARMLFEAAQKLHLAGHNISPVAVVASIPHEAADHQMLRSMASSAASAALPLSQISGPVFALRETWARRQVSGVCQQYAKRAADQFENPFDVAAQMVSEMDVVAEKRSGRNALQSASQAAESLSDAICSRERVETITTGLRSLDDAFGGYGARKMYVIAGRPGMGKSAFMVASLTKTAMAGHGVVLFSLEVDQAEIIARMLASVSGQRGPGFGDIAKRRLSDSDIEDVLTAKDSIAGLPLYIDDGSAMPWGEIAAKSRRLKASFEAEGKRLRVVCVDHLGLVAPTDRYSGNKVAETGEVSKQAKALAKELDVCVVLLSQLNRGVEGRDNKRPTMADLRWSGDIEQDADMVAFLYREAYYLKDDQNVSPTELEFAQDRLEFLIRKNRQGETGDHLLRCNMKYSLIEDRT